MGQGRRAAILTVSDGVFHGTRTDDSGRALAELLSRSGFEIAETEMFRAFNMGVGMVIICAAADAAAIESHLKSQDEKCYQIGRVVAGEQRVTFI